MPRGGKHGVVYTDGACSRNGQYGARAGVGNYWGEGNPYNVSAPVSGGRHTNNAAEIEAATRAVQGGRAQGYDSVTIKTDSEFLTNCQNKWGDKWESNGWRTANNEPVKNRAELSDLRQEIRESGMDVKFEYVPGHAGNAGNEAADKLAKSGAKY